MKKALLIASLVLAFSGTAKASDIVEVSPGVYMANAKNWAGMFGSAASSKAKVLKIANDFAKSKGMVAIPINLEVETAIPGSRMGGASYQFRLVSPDSPEARGSTYLQRGADTITEVNVNSTDKTPRDTPRVDMYGELIKLDDLRKRGILSEAEFNAAKQKLLQQP